MKWTSAEQFTRRQQGLKWHVRSLPRGVRMNSAALEKHYRVRELASLWGFSENTIIRIFAHEPGVIRLESAGGTRKYATLSIPESVALRVHERLGQEPHRPDLAVANPIRIVRLRDLRTPSGQELAKHPQSQGR